LPSELKQQLTNAELVELLAFHNLQLNAASNPKPTMTNEQAEQFLSSMGARKA